MSQMPTSITSQSPKRCLSRTNTVTSLAKKAADEEPLVLSTGKMVLHVLILLLLWVWWNIFGLWLMPVYVYVGVLLLPLQFGHWDMAERMEVRSVIIIYFIILSTPVLIAWCVLRGGRLAVTALGLYTGWAIYLDKAPFTGRRFCPALRKRTFWVHFAAYFPMKLTRTEELEPTRNYIFGYHPHGIISLGALCNFATDATGFSKLFPGIDIRLLTLAMNFKIPFFREYLLGLGINDASRLSCERNLTRGPGASIMLVVGGARESLETSPGKSGLVLADRKGFVKIALRTGASLVPVFSFGENDVFGVYHNDKLKMWQLRMQKKLGFAVPFFFGRALTGGILHRVFGMNVGVMPLRVPMHTVVGRPVHLDKVDQPTQEQIDKAHADYIKNLKDVYDEWKDIFAEERKEVLKQMKDSEPERFKVLNASVFELDDHEELAFVS